jgi:hypothetical protein
MSVRCSGGEIQPISSELVDLALPAHKKAVPAQALIAEPRSIAAVESKRTSESILNARLDMNRDIVKPMPAKHETPTNCVVDRSDLIAHRALTANQQLIKIPIGFPMQSPRIIPDVSELMLKDALLKTIPALKNAKSGIMSKLATLCSMC